jgi:hypothetical protein
MMKTRLTFARLRAPALCLTLCTLAVSATAHAQNNITFDAPGAGTAGQQGTFAYTINPSGTIAGFTRDTHWVRHVFLRDSNGNFTIFDAPGAGTCSSPCGNPGTGPGTRAYSLNAAGTITGFYTGNTGPAHGYLRTATGTFTSFDAPDAGTGGPYPQGTLPGFEGSINTAGAVTGEYTDSSNVVHSFVRTPDGTITEFDPPGSIFSQGVAINSAGRSRDSGKTRSLRVTASCALPTAPSLRSTSRGVAVTAA